MAGYYIPRARVKAMLAAIKADGALMAEVWDKHHRERGDFTRMINRDGKTPRARCHSCGTDKAMVFSRAGGSGDYLYGCFACRANGINNTGSVIKLLAEFTGRCPRRNFLSLITELVDMQAALHAKQPPAHEVAVIGKHRTSPSRTRWLGKVVSTRGFLAHNERVIGWLIFAGFSRQYPLPATRTGIARAAARHLKIPFDTCYKAIQTADRLGLLVTARAGFQWRMRDIARGRAVMAFINAAAAERKLAKLRVILEFYVRGMSGVVMANLERLREKCSCSAKTITRVIGGIAHRGIAIVKDRWRTAVNFAFGWGDDTGEWRAIIAPSAQPPPPTT